MGGWELECKTCYVTVFIIIVFMIIVFMIIVFIFYYRVYLIQ